MTHFLPGEEAENEDLIRRRGGTLRARESVWPLPPRAAE